MQHVYSSRQSELMILDYSLQVGACLLSSDGETVIGTGYNGLPVGCSDDNLPWNKSEDKEKGKDMYGKCQAKHPWGSFEKSS